MPSCRAFLSLPILLLLGAFAAPCAHASQSPAQPSANAVASSVEVINGSSRTIRTFGSSQSAMQPASREGSVEVMNGNLQRTVVLNPPRPAYAPAPHAKLNPHRRAKIGAASHPVATAEILNGNQRETRVFNQPSDSIPTATAGRNPVVIAIASKGASGNGPVVVGVASSNSGPASPVVVHIVSSESEGNAQPVVIGVESSGIASDDGAVQPVAIGVSPRPSRRRPYRPAALDAQ